MKLAPPLGDLTKVCATFGGHLKSIRTRRRMSQSAVAAAAKTHKNVISTIERGRTYPSLKMIYKLAQALHCPPVELGSLLFYERLRDTPELRQQFILTDEEKDFLLLYRSLPPDYKRILTACINGIKAEHEERQKWRSPKR